MSRGEPKITKAELKRRIKKLNLSVYEAAILLGFTSPSRIYSRQEVSTKTMLALDRLELLSSIGRLEDEKKKNAKAINTLAKKVRQSSLKEYHKSKNLTKAAGVKK